ncbi:MAG: glycosyltransferase family 2 protein [Vicinamibacterales bacterium]
MTVSWGRSMVSPQRLRVSVVIPARNASESLGDCLAALHRSARGRAEVIVVDDGSTDGTADVARMHDAHVIRREVSGGPAAARNDGAREASADIIMFLDADVVIAENAISRVLQAFDDDPELAAVFGSYDHVPVGGTPVSDYRNLLHHFVHQSAREESTSFWAGCGAVRRTVFLVLGGFDEGYTRPSIEDIQFGAALATIGHRVRLDKKLFGSHRKRWTLGNLLLVDVRDRAYPWARLILRQGRMPDDLNLRHEHRVSAVLVWVAVASAVGLLAGWPGGWAQHLWPALAIGVIGVLALNRRFYKFVWKQRGIRFATMTYLLHALYYGYASATFAWAWFCHAVIRTRPPSEKVPAPQRLPRESPLGQSVAAESSDVPALDRTLAAAPSLAAQPNPEPASNCKG